MIYIGSKASIAKQILTKILENRVDDNQPYVEPFCGGCNVIDKVSGTRIAADNNLYLIEMWKKLVYENWIPESVDKDLYIKVRNKPWRYPDWLVGYIGFVCSFRGKWFGGWKTNYITKRINAGHDRKQIQFINHQTEARNNILKQITKLKDTKFLCSEYYNLDIPSNAIVYCDPPYKGTLGYLEKFNHTKFWEWCRKLSKDNPNVYISESNAPNDFVPIWLKIMENTMRCSHKHNTKLSTFEYLFKHKDTITKDESNGN